MQSTATKSRRNRTSIPKTLGVLLATLSAVASLTSCTQDEAVQAACSLATPAIRLVAVALKFTPTAPASVGLDVLGIASQEGCKSLYKAIKSDTVARTTKDYLVNTPYLATEWRVPENAELCGDRQSGAYRSAYTGIAEQSPAAANRERHTTCQFTEAVRDQYITVGGLPPIDDPTALPNNRTLSVFSDWAYRNGKGEGGWLRMACWGGYPVTCQGGIDNDALVFLV